MTRLLLVGAAGMDWPAFEDAVRSGAVPHMAALRRRGTAGWLAGAPNAPGPGPWASLLTGVEPEVHGVWRDREEWPGGLRPTGRASWRVAPAWARLEATGITTGSVGWPASRPGSAWEGIHVDQDFALASGRTPGEWALAPHCAPDDARGALRGRRVHPTQITAAMLQPLVPDLGAIDQSRDADLPRLAVGLAQSATIQAAAAWMLDANDRPADGGIEAVFVHHPCLALARQVFEARDEAQFAQVIPGVWRLLDGFIGRLVQLAGPEALVLVVSPGWRSAPGVVVAAGPDVSPGAEFTGAGVLSIAPTVLRRFGLVDSALRAPPLPFVPAKAEISPAPAVPARPPEKPDARLVYALRKHGYRPPPRSSRSWRAQGMAELAQMVLPRDAKQAGAIADRALSLDPHNILALRIRVRAHVALEEAEPLPPLAERLLKVAPERGWGPLAHGAHHVLRREIRLAQPWLSKAEADPDVETLLTVAAVWIAASRHGAAERVFNAVHDRDPENVSADIGLALCQSLRRDFLGAEATLNRALNRDPTRPAIHLQLAQILARSGRKAEAADVARVALRLGASPEMAAAARAGRLGA